MRRDTPPRNPTAQLACITIGFLLALGASPALAQSIRGVALHGDDGRTVPGVVLLLVDEAGATRARAVTLADGSFLLRAPGAGRYRIDTRRIGFSAGRGDVFGLSGDTTITLRLSRIAVALPPIRAVDRDRCSASPDVALPAGILWDDARTALFAADIALRGDGHRFDFVVHTRLYDMLSPPILLDSPFEYMSNEGFEPWKSLPADSIARQGYVTVDSTGVRYVAPDLAVLLSPYFTAQHCFRVVESRDGTRARIGLDFTPTAHGRRTEIRGTIWLDRETRELSEITFRYVGLPYRTRGDVAGGSVEFLRLSSGTWVLPQWSVRAPIPERDLLANPRRHAESAVNVAGAPPSRAAESQYMRVTGGSLLAVRSGPPAGAPLWERPTRALELAVLEQDDGAPRARATPGATVGITGSIMQQVTDSSGVARFERLVPGEYLLEYSTWSEVALGIPPRRATIAVPAGEGAVRHEVRARTPEQSVASVCGRDNTLAVVAGTVTRGDRLAAGAPLSLRSIVPPGVVADTHPTLTTKARADGRYGICSVPRLSEFAMSTPRPDGSEHVERIHIPLGTWILVVDVVVPPES